MRIEPLVISAMVLIIAFSAGCISEKDKTAALDAISPVVVLKGSTQYCIQFPAECKQNTSTVTIITTEPTPTPTPVITVTVEPVSTYYPIDEFAGGERKEGQWYKWSWSNASGYETANRGIIVYGHSYHDKLTQWNEAWGNYQPLDPPKGYRFIAVYVHEEEFGPDSPDTWGYDKSYFYLQYTGHPLIQEYEDYDKVNRIIELEDVKHDYYNIDRLRPFGMIRLYSKSDEYISTGGYHIQFLYDLRRGQGNSWDGYIIYAIPKTVTDNDIRIVGNFAGKSVNWKFGSIATPPAPVVKVREKVEIPIV